jgi:hypothetical protein
VPESEEGQLPIAGFHRTRPQFIKKVVQSPAAVLVNFMFCPLCKEEYRAGPVKCSDCLAALVATRADADATKIVLLWKGTRESTFSELAGALRDANIPNLAEPGFNTDIPHWPFTFWRMVPIIGQFLRARDGYKEIKQDFSWEIFVLESDYARARALEDQPT